MSYVELQERLQYLKAKNAAAEEAKRQEILFEKATRENVLQDKLSLIAKARAEMGRTRPPRHTMPVSSEASIARPGITVCTQAQQKIVVSNSKVDELREQLAQKKYAVYADMAFFTRGLAGRCGRPRWRQT